MGRKKLSIEHLSEESRSLFRSIQNEFQIEDPGGIAILKTACEAYDRAQAARIQIDADGMVQQGRDQQPKPHVLLTVERDNRAAFLSGLKMLNLDLEPLKTVGRPSGR